MVDSTLPSKHAVIASWLFGSLLLLFYIGVFVWAPSELPGFKQKQLAIFSALLCALFTFFFIGTLKVTLHVKNRWGRVGVQSGGGAAAFVLILWWWNNPTYAPVQIQNEVHEINQTLKHIDTIVVELQNELNVKNDQIAFLQTQLQSQRPEPSAKAKALAAQIPDNADAYARALKAIAEERYDAAMRLLDDAQAQQEAGLVNIYLAKSDAEYYQGHYAQALGWSQKALALQPEDARLLNQTGLMFDYAGHYVQAEPFFKPQPPAPMPRHRPILPKFIISKNSRIKASTRAFIEKGNATARLGAMSKAWAII